MGIKRFDQLEAWQFAHRAMLETYRITAGFPSDEKYRLTDQMRRAAISMTGNIAEGFRRRKPMDKIRFYNYSEGSIEELRNYFMAARDLNYMKDITAVGELLDSAARKLNRLITKIASSPLQQAPGTAPPPDSQGPSPVAQ